MLRTFELFEKQNFKQINSNMMDTPTYNTYYCQMKNDWFHNTKKKFKFKKQISKLVLGKKEWQEKEMLVLTCVGVGKDNDDYIMMIWHDRGSFTLFYSLISVCLCVLIFLKQPWSSKFLWLLVTQQQQPLQGE